MTDARTLVIAEIGVNHNGDMATALELVKAARDSGADLVKTQTYEPSLLAARVASKAAYQQRNGAVGESQREMLEAYRLTALQTADLIDFANSIGVGFLSTPFDIESLRILTDELGIRAIKLSSGDLTNGPLLLATARSAESIIISTGMSSIDEVQEALSVLAFGFARERWEVPSDEALQSIWRSGVMRSSLEERVSILHCVSAYPAPIDEVNLRAMVTLESAFGLRVGFSDHTAGVNVALAAVARGARIVEKHLTLDRTQKGPDHAASLEPAEFAHMVSGIREIERALGDGVKGPMPSEAQSRIDGRRSVRASRALAKGEILAEDDLVMLRPAGGRSPMRMWELLGQPANRAYEAEECID